MRLKDEILMEHSKLQCMKIARWIGNSQQRFDELFYLFLNDEYPAVQRAAWPLSVCVIEHPALIKKHFGKLIANLRRPGLHNAVKRNTIRLLQGLTIPKKYHGEIMDMCFTYISDPDEAAAVKAFSLKVLHDLSKLYPDIKQELRTIIEERWDYETAAFKSRAKRIIAEEHPPG